MGLSEHTGYVAGLVKGRAFKKNIPLTVSITVTNRCNYKCIYCYGAYYDRKDKDVPTKVWCDLIDELAGMGTKMIHLGGGEPLLRNDIDVIIAKVKDSGMICRINTNGALIPKMIDKLRRVDSICVSLDGKEAANDRNRGDGTFKEIIAGIKCAKDNGISTHVSATVTTNSIEAADEVLELAKEIGFMVEFGLPYEQTTANKDIEAVQLRDEHLKRFLKRILKYKSEGEPIFYSDSTYEYALNWPVPYSVKLMYDEPPEGFKKIDCYMGKYMCFIDGDGMVYPCGQLIGSFPALNFMETGFKKAWKNLAPNKKCKTCYCPCFTEFNQLYGLKMNVMANNAVREIKGMLKRKSRSAGNGGAR